MIGGSGWATWCKSAPIKKRLDSHQVSVVDDVEVSLLVDVFLLVMDRLNLRCLPHASHRLWLVEILCRSAHEFQCFFFFSREQCRMRQIQVGMVAKDKCGREKNER